MSTNQDRGWAVDSSQHARHRVGGLKPRRVTALGGDQAVGKIPGPAYEGIPTDGGPLTLIAEPGLVAGLKVNVPQIRRLAPAQWFDMNEPATEHAGHYLIVERQGQLLGMWTPAARHIEHMSVSTPAGRRVYLRQAKED